MNKNIVNLIKNRFKNEKNIIIYGSFIVSSPNHLKLDDFNDIDIIQIVPRRNACKRLTYYLYNKEIHLYRLSKEIIKKDTENNLYGRYHSCHLWGPLLLINIDNKSQIENCIQNARKMRVGEILNYMSIFQVKSFKTEDLLSYLYFIEGMLKPYTFLFGPKYLLKKDHKIIKKWIEDYKIILKSFLGNKIEKKGARYFFLNKNKENFYELYTNDSINTLISWKKFLLYHNNDWDQVTKIAYKSVKYKQKTEKFYKNIKLLY